jgi:Pentapeptide repeats (9 copies)
MGDGTKENPFTKDELLKLVNEFRSRGEVPDFSKKEFEEGIDLSGCDLSGVIFKDAIFPTSFKRDPSEGPNLAGAHLEKADFSRAHLERSDLSNTHLEEAVLWHAHLEEATLWDTHLDGANLVGTHLEGANLIRTKFSSDVDLEDVEWGDYILDEEKRHLFDSAVASYRHLKVWYANAGYHDTAAKFYYREREANRKLLKWRSENFRHRLGQEILRALFGYGEHWERILGWMAGIIFISAIIYFFINSIWTWSAFGHSLYFSAASFTAVGYGNWIDNNWFSGYNSWIIGLGVTETVVGVFLMALLLVTFVRKWTR